MNSLQDHDSMFARCLINLHKPRSWGKNDNSLNLTWNPIFMKISHTFQIYEVQVFEPSQSQGSKQHGVVKRCYPHCFTGISSESTKRWTLTTKISKEKWNRIMHLFELLMTKVMPQYNRSLWDFYPPTNNIHADITVQNLLMMQTP
jgi:hypothetical protein